MNEFYHELERRLVNEKDVTHTNGRAVGHFFIGLRVPLTVPAQQTNFPKVKEYRIERSVPPVAVACIECHRATTPGLFADWAKSRHANANITCLDCHLVQPGDTDIAKGHEKYYSRSDMP